MVLSKNIPACTLIDFNDYGYRSNNYKIQRQNREENSEVETENIELQKGHAIWQDNQISLESNLISTMSLHYRQIWILSFLGLRSRLYWTR